MILDQQDWGIRYVYLRASGAGPRTAELAQLSGYQSQIQAKKRHLWGPIQRI